MPSEISDTKQTPIEDGSSAQTSKEDKTNVVGAKGDDSQENVSTGEQKRKKKKRRKPVPHDQRRMVQALGRIEGRILPEGSGIQIVTEDGAKFRVRSIGKPGLAVRLLALPDNQRFGKFSFWPAFSKSGITISSFSQSDDWEPQENSPPVDQMFVCGKLQEVESDRFSVLVGYEMKKKSKWTPRLLTVDNAPLPEWAVGSWVDLILNRQGEDWLWQGEFHPRGPLIGGGFNSWLPYTEASTSQDALQTQ